MPRARGCARRFAADTAQNWRDGLASWGQDHRIPALKDAAEFSIYTPGSDAGLPISILADAGPLGGWDPGDELPRADQRHRHGAAGADWQRCRPRSKTASTS